MLGLWLRLMKSTASVSHNDANHKFMELASGDEKISWLSKPESKKKLAIYIFRPKAKEKEENLNKAGQ